MSKSQSKNVSFLIVGNEESRRISLFQEALRSENLPPARVLNYSAILAGASIADAITPNTIVRIESPGKNFEVQKQILALGAQRAEEQDLPFIPAPATTNIPFRKGQILFPTSGISDSAICLI